MFLSRVGGGCEVSPGRFVLFWQLCIHKEEKRSSIALISLSLSLSHSLPMSQSLSLSPSRFIFSVLMIIAIIMLVVMITAFDDINDNDGALKIMMVTAAD